ncbi:MAG: alpha/beta hydrolase [Panacibacter sp.]
MKVYFLSGLGADKTVFQFLDLSFCEPVFVEWIPPQKNESLSAYAVRIMDVYRIPADAIITGLSFGGMLATEIAKANSSTHAVLISSAKTKKELPGFYKIGKFLSFHNWANSEVQRWFMLNIKWLFGIKNPSYIKVYEALIRNSDTDFNKWAVNALLTWNNTEIPGNIIHIHGTDDRIIPYRNVQCNYTIKQGGHLMVMEQASLVSKILKESINQRNSILSSSASQPAHRSRA